MTISLPIKHNDATLAWEAVCPDCLQTTFMVTEEAVAAGPRRPSGSSLLLPIPMCAYHECEAGK